MAKLDPEAHNRHTREALIAGRESEVRSSETVEAAYKSGNLPFFIEWAEAALQADPDGPKKERLQISLEAARANINEGCLRGAAFHAFFAGYFLGVTGDLAEEMKSALAQRERQQATKLSASQKRWNKWQSTLDALRRKHPRQSREWIRQKVADEHDVGRRIIEKRTVWKDSPPAPTGR